MIPNSSNKSEFDAEPTQLARRDFFRRSATLGACAVSAATLQTLVAHTAWAEDHAAEPRGRSRQRIRVGYGPLQPVLARNADRLGLTNPVILALPEGFEYWAFSLIGRPMSDGNLVPVNLDGMGAFAWRHGQVRLIRNHEVRNNPGVSIGGVGGPEGTRYDANAYGGTVTIDFDVHRMQVVNEFVSLNGTMVNCSGGLAYRDKGWITAEETVDGPGRVVNGVAFQQKHGYNFLVPVDRDRLDAGNRDHKAVPIVSMGRFAKEAAVAHPKTGDVYQTEDPGNARGAGFYRYIPNDPDNIALDRGRLFMLKIKGQPQADLRDGQVVGKLMDVEWVSIDDPDPALENGATSVFNQGFAKGGAKFNRLEGVFRGTGDTIYFVSTSGGDAKSSDNAVTDEHGVLFREGFGQLWELIPDAKGGDRLALVFESPAGSVLDSPDNLCVTPRGGILFCEDDASGRDDDSHRLAPSIADVNRLVGLSPEGAPFDFAVNLISDAEFAGACFSPDGKILFVNVFGEGTPDSGMTLAIRGPWERGPL